MRFHLYFFFCVHSFFCFLFLFFISLCLFDDELLFLNTCRKMMNGVGWLDQGFLNFWCYGAHEEIDHNLRSPTISFINAVIASLDSCKLSQVSILISKQIARRAPGLRTEHFENLWTRWPPRSFANPTWHSTPLCLHWSSIVPLCFHLL